MKKFSTLSIGFLFASALSLSAQNSNNLPDDIAEPVFQKQMKVATVDYKGEEIPCVELPNTLVYPELQFKSAKEWNRYIQLVRNVKKVLPIAKEVNSVIVETYEYLQTLPTKKAKDQHIKLVEKGIKKQYTPRMKKLTYKQGKLLIKLVNRECNSTGYELVKAFLGPIRAGVYQAFAAIYGASLTKKYDPEVDDRLTERVVLLVESGQL